MSNTYLENWEKVKRFVEDTIIYNVENGLEFDPHRYPDEFLKHYDMLFVMLKTKYYNKSLTIKRNTTGDDDMKGNDDVKDNDGYSYKDDDVEDDDDDDEELNDEKDDNADDMPRNEVNKLISKHIKNFYRGYKIVMEDYLGYVLSQFHEVEQKSDTDFLKVWSQRWDKFTQVLTHVCNVFKMIDSAYIVEYKLISKNPTFSTTQQGYKMYKRMVFDKFYERARQLILEQVRDEREGKSIDTETLKGAIDVFVQLGDMKKEKKVPPKEMTLDEYMRRREEFEDDEDDYEEYDPNDDLINHYEDYKRRQEEKVRTRFYRKFLEGRIIEDTKAYYHNKFEDWFKNNSVNPAMFLQKIEEVTITEKKRVKMYLHPSTEKKIIDACLNKSIKLYFNEVIRGDNGLKMMLQQNHTDDLKRMYSLFKTHPRELKESGDIFEQYIKQTLYQRVTKYRPVDASSSTAPVADITGTDMVHEMVQFHRHVINLVHSVFQDDIIFTKAVEIGFRDQVNETSKAIARFADMVLRKGVYDDKKKDDAKETEEILEQIVYLYSYIQDKDVFEHEYQNLLARRLCMNMSRSLDMEQAILAKFNKKAGYSWITKLNHMFQDATKSKELMTTFHQTHNTETEFGMELDVTMCRAGYWPSPVFSTSCGTLPQDKRFRAMCACFEEFYKRTYPGHKVRWRMDQGMAEVQVTWPNGTTYTFGVTTCMMLILLVLQDNPTATVSCIMEQTGISFENLYDHILTLCHPNYKILQKRPNAIRLLKTDKVRLNPNFKPNTPSRRIIVGLKKFRKPFSTTEIKEPPERVFQIDATIIRTMKTHHKLGHNKLISNVVEQLQHRFKPQPQQIKKRIEILIDQNYMKRDAEDRSVYIYLA